MFNSIPSLSSPDARSVPSPTLRQQCLQTLPDVHASRWEARGLYFSHTTWMALSRLSPFYPSAFFFFFFKFDMYFTLEYGSILSIWVSQLWIAYDKNLFCREMIGFLSSCALGLFSCRVMIMCWGAWNLFPLARKSPLVFFLQHTASSGVWAGKAPWWSI